MTRQAIIEHTIQVINHLPAEKATEISDFADLVSMKYEAQKITATIQKMVTDSQTFAFLHEEEDLYSLSDLKERY